MEENYEGKSETEHLIRQAAREVGAGPIEIKASLDAPATYDVTFKNRRGDESKISVPFEAAYKSIVAALTAGWKGHKSGD